MAPIIRRSALQILACLLILCLLLSPVDAQSETDSLAWANDVDALLFYEALVKIEKNALDPEPSRKLVQKSIRAYLRQKDKFSDYLSADDYAAYRQSQKHRYIGVGMDIWADQNGDLVCIPFPDSPAARSGIRYGDRLHKIDGHTLAGRSVFAAAGLIRRQPGTEVVLTVRKKYGEIQIHRIERKSIRSQSVLLRRAGTLPVLQIMRFNRSAIQEFKDLLTTIKDTPAMILDLRGNTGGDLFAAADIAAVFLKSGQKIMNLRTNAGETPYFAKETSVDFDSKVFIWQDRYTASAAEVLISALTENERARSVGTQTFGKGLAQKIVELTDGSAMLISYADITTPTGKSFHGTGLQATFSLKPNFPEPQQAYLNTTHKILTMMDRQ